MNTALKIEKTLAYVLYFSGFYALFKAIRNSSRNVRILTYHSITDDSGNMVTRDSFDRQMDYLSVNYVPISFSEFLEGSKGNSVRKKSIIVTLDDGYMDNYANAYPILKKHNIPAMIFPLAGSIDRERMLGWSEMKEMGEPIAFGAHTMTHPVLSKLPKKDAEKEIVGSKEVLEKGLSRKVDVFAYPYGSRADFNEETKSIVRRNFSCAVTTIPGVNDLDNDLFELRRIGCSHENDFIVFKVKVSGALSPFIKLYRKGE